MGEPVCLIKWLRADESEVERVHVEWRDKIAIRVVHARSKQEVFDAIRAWASENEAAQCLYIAAHGRQREKDGEYVGIDGGEGDEYIAWFELGVFLAENAQSSLVVWLGACGSAAAANGWRECLKQGYVPALWLVGFGDIIIAPILEATIDRALSNMRMEDVVFVERELPLLREAAGGAVEMFYPAHAKDTNRSEFVSIEDFPERVGCSFSEFVRRGHA